MVWRDLFPAFGVAWPGTAQLPRGSSSSWQVPGVWGKDPAHSPSALYPGRLSRMCAYEQPWDSTRQQVELRTPAFSPHPHAREPG